MDIESIKSLVAQKESHTLEFKKSTAQLKSAFETLCAFLNEQGGIVLVGVIDNGQVIGQDVTDNTRQEIARELNKIEPPTQITVNYVPMSNGKQVIVLQAHAGSYLPYVYDSRPFQRNQSTTIKMAQHRYEQLLSTQIRNVRFLQIRNVRLGFPNCCLMGVKVAVLSTKSIALPAAFNS